jgi:hypothetical protein
MLSTLLIYLLNSDAMAAIIWEVLTSISESHGITCLILANKTLYRYSSFKFIRVLLDEWE